MRNFQWRLGEIEKNDSWKDIFLAFSVVAYLLLLIQ